MTRLSETIKRTRLGLLDEVREALARYHEGRGYGETIIAKECDEVVSKLITQELSR